MALLMEPDERSTSQWRSDCRRSQEGRTAMKSDDKRRPARRSNPHRYPESRMNRPPPHVHGKEGAAVRVRQRALQKRRKSALFFSAPLAALSTCTRYGAVYGLTCARGHKPDSPKLQLRSSRDVDGSEAGVEPVTSAGAGLSYALGSRSSGCPSEACGRPRRGTRALRGQCSGMTPGARVGRQPICSASPMRMPSGPRT
jgi:hypothetical protein